MSVVLTNRRCWAGTVRPAPALAESFLRARVPSPGPGSLTRVVADWPARRRSRAGVPSGVGGSPDGGDAGACRVGDGQLAGPGAVIARRLARDGFAVAVNGRPGDDLVAAVGRGIGDDGGVAEGFVADVGDEDQVAGLVAAITSCLGPVEVLVLNATGP